MSVGREVWGGKCELPSHLPAQAWAAFCSTGCWGASWGSQGHMHERHRHRCLCAVKAMHVLLLPDSANASLTFCPCQPSHAHHAAVGPLQSGSVFCCMLDAPFYLLNREFAHDTACTLCTCRYLIYVGECRGGVNGTDGFFDALKKVRGSQGSQGGRLKLGNGIAFSCRRVGMGMEGEMPPVQRAAHYSFCTPSLAPCYGSLPRACTEAHPTWPVFSAVLYGPYSSQHTASLPHVTGYNCAHLTECICAPHFSTSLGTTAHRRPVCRAGRRPRTHLDACLFRTVSLPHLAPACCMTCAGLGGGQDCALRPLS